MKPIKCFSLMPIVFLLAIGCSGTYGEFKTQSESESKVTKRELIDNWSDYDIWLHYHPSYIPPRLVVIIFDPNNDDREILVGSNGIKVTDQQMWTAVVKENTTSDGEFTLVPNVLDLYAYSTEPTAVREILGPDNQLYGFTLYMDNMVSLQRVNLVDENRIRLSWGASWNTQIGGYGEW